MSDFYAHTRQGGPPPEWLRLSDHLRETADLAGQFAAAVGYADWARLAGLWHDLGEYSQEFQDYLHRAGNADEGAAGPKGHVDHATAGAQQAVRSLGQEYGRILAYVIAGHHGGLPDWDWGEKTERGTPCAAWPSPCSISLAHRRISSSRIHCHCRRYGSTPIRFLSRSSSWLSLRGCCSPVWWTPISSPPRGS